MKKTISLAIAVLLLMGAIPMVLAADVLEQTTLVTEKTIAAENDIEEFIEEPIIISPIETGDEVVEDITEEIGATPDEPVRFWFKRARENLKLAFTADKTKRVQLRLEFAEKRLAETQKMIKENKGKSAEKAQKIHDRLMEKVGEDLQELKETTGEEELEKVTGLERAVQAHEAHIAKFREKFQNMNLTEEQKQKFEEIAGKFEEKTENLRNKIDEKIKRVKNRIRAEKNGEIEEEAEEEEENETDEEENETIAIGAPITPGKQIKDRVKLQEERKKLDSDASIDE